jgi:type II secretory pathway component PulF
MTGKYKISHLIFLVITKLTLGMQIFVHSVIVPKFVEMFNDMSIDLPRLTLILINFNPVFLYLFIFILILMSTKEILLKNKATAFIINISYLVVSLIYITFLVAALLMPLIELKDSI